MSVGKQFAVMKENWLLVVLGLVVLIFISGSTGIVRQSFDSAKGMYEDRYVAMSDSEMLDYSPRTNNGDFAPEIEERKIVKSSSLSNEIERGEFGEAEIQLKNIVVSSGAYLLNERVNRNGEGWRAYYYGSYSLKVDSLKYNSVVDQLKKIGEVKSFSENMFDVTARYDEIEIEIGVERARLLRYEEMYAEAEAVSDKIDLNDRIFNQERQIKYLENSLENVENRIDYSSISFSMSEERSNWIDISLVGLSSLVRSFVGSINGLLQLIFVVIPWGLGLLIIMFFWKRFKK